MFHASVAFTAGAITFERVAPFVRPHHTSVVVVADRGQGEAVARACAEALALSGMTVSLALPLDGCKDTNALLQAHGLEAVRAMIAEAEPIAREPHATSIEGAPAYVSFGPYRMSFERGLTFIDPDPDKPALHLSSAFEVLAETRSSQGESWGLLLRWADPDGTTHMWAMPRALLAGDGQELRRELLDRGLFVAPQQKARTLLLAYFGQVRTSERARAVDRIGWHGATFVLPDETFAPPAHDGTGASRPERVVLQTETALPHAFRVSGTLEEWQGESAPVQGQQPPRAERLRRARSAPARPCRG